MRMMAMKCGGNERAKRHSELEMVRRGRQQDSKRVRQQERTMQETVRDTVREWQGMWKGMARDMAYCMINMSPLGARTMFQRIGQNRR